MSILETGDGSNTYVSKIFGETYHSRHGALSESLHVFIQEGLERYLQMYPNKSGIRIFEMGLGTGLNVVLTFLYSMNKESIPPIHYTAIEKFPLSAKEASSLAYEEMIPDGNAEHILHKIHHSKWQEWVNFTSRLHLFKIEDDFWNFESKDPFDIVYYDAFAPSAQKELWSLEACHKLYRMMSDQSLLTTYCAQGQFKRNLRSAGFRIEAVAGPPGKREMTLAYKE